MADDLDDLRAADPEKRYNAVLRLCGRGPLSTEAMAMLVEMLSDDGRFDEDVGDYYGGPWYEARFVSEAAEEALSRAADADAIRASLERLLEAGVPAARRHAARLLGRSVEARDLLLRALGDDDGRVRQAALESLLAMRPKTSPLDDELLLRRILERVWDDDADVSRAAAEGIGKLDLHPRFGELVGAAVELWRPRLLDGGREIQRISACRVLGLLPDDRAAASLLADVLLGEKSETVLRYAAEGLSRSRVILDVARLEGLMGAALERRMSYARPPFLAVLGKQGRPDRLAVLALPFALDGEPNVIASAPLFDEVCAAARAVLTACGDAARPLVPAMAEALRSDEARQTRALHLMGALPAVADLIVPLLVAHLRAQTVPERIEAALDTLRRLGERAVAAFPAVLDYIRPSSHWRVSTAATKAVAAMGDVARQACPALEAVLAHREHQVLVLHAITQMGKCAAPLRPFLARLAESSDHTEVRRLARAICDGLT